MSVRPVELDNSGCSPERAALSPSFLPLFGPVGCGRPFGPNRRSSESTASCRVPPSARGGHSSFRGSRGGLGLNPEELVEGGEELGAAEPTLLDVDDGAVCIVEGGHG